MRLIQTEKGVSIGSRHEDVAIYKKELSS